ncbi:MAG: hypothetical protein KA144_07205 [Xanthomonadaceae bacterium]|nr:hypothetical protein [Xanthomonadaceae bacterium]
MTDWSGVLFSGSLYALGFVGLFGIALLPLRVFRAVFRNASLWRASRLGKAALVLVGVVGIAAIALSVPNVARVFRCLTEGLCGPNRASAWLALCFVGAFYLAFEAISIATLTFARKRHEPHSFPAEAT